MDPNVKRLIPDGLLTYRSQLSRSRGIQKKLPKNKRESEKMQREKRTEKEDLEKDDLDRDGGVVLAIVEGEVEAKGVNVGADIKDMRCETKSQFICSS